MSSDRLTQPVIVSPSDVPRFRENALVRYLLSVAQDKGLGLSHMASLPNIPQEDWDQLAQLLGYSIEGYAELSYALHVEEAYAAARAQGWQPTSAPASEQPFGSAHDFAQQVLCGHCPAEALCPRGAQLDACMAAAAAGTWRGSTHEAAILDAQAQMG